MPPTEAPSSRATPPTTACHAVPPCRPAKAEPHRQRQAASPVLSQPPIAASSTSPCRSCQRRALAGTVVASIPSTAGSCQCLCRSRPRRALAACHARVVPIRQRQATSRRHLNWSHQKQAPPPHPRAGSSMPTTSHHTAPTSPRLQARPWRSRRCLHHSSRREPTAFMLLSPTATPDPM